MEAQTETRRNDGAPPAALIDTDAAALWLGMASTTLRRWRSEGRGPRWVRVGRLAKYRVADLAAWAEAHVVESGDTR